jgi:cytoskeletal protein CcmA (bactofilin family)
MAVVLGMFALSALFFYFICMVIKNMFSFKSNEIRPIDEINKTVIDRTIVFDGDVSANGVIEVFGVVNGCIHNGNGEVNIKEGGKVTGNIEANVLRIDGDVRGECSANVIDIFANGFVDGMLNCENLSVVPGGKVSGSIQMVNKETYESTLIELNSASYGGSGAN